MNNQPLFPFHLSIPVSDLDKARGFYIGIVGCSEGRSKRDRVDFNFFGHHIVAHLSPEEAAHQTLTTAVKGEDQRYPIRHFGVILPMEEWKKLAGRMTRARVKFVMKPQARFPGDVRESSVMQCEDTCGNVVEFKGMDRERIFATEKPKR